MTMTELSEILRHGAVIDGLPCQAPYTVHTVYRGKSEITGGLVLSLHFTEESGRLLEEQVAVLPENAP